MKLLMTAPAIQAKLAAPQIISILMAPPAIAKLQKPELMKVESIIEELALLLEQEWDK